MAKPFSVFILMAVDIQKLKKISNYLLRQRLIENVHELYGRFDILVRLIGKDQDEVEQFIHQKIRSVPPIKRTETLVVSHTLKETPSKRRMGGLKRSEAYILLVTKYGKKRDVAKKLIPFDEIERVEELYGQYDILVKLKARTQKQLEEFNVEHIRSIKDVETTETLLVSDVPS